MKVIVLGSGIIGMTTAYFLAKDGHEVTVLEKNDASALGCSYANGGQLSYCHIEPWASKTALKAVCKAMVRPSSFLAISSLFNRELLKWFFAFLRNASSKKNRENSRKLFEIGSFSKAAFADILKDEEVIFDYKSEGILHFFRGEKLFKAGVEQSQYHASFGCKAQILTGAQCVKKEPMLKKLLDEGKLVGGIFYNMDASGNCFLFAKALEKICKEKYQVRFKYETQVNNILTDGKKITGIHTSKGVFTADKYVSTLGAYGNEILKGIGVKTGIYPLKGYSLSILADETGFEAPRLSLTDPENKVVYSRVGDIFRAAGTVEICDFSVKANKRLLGFLKKTVQGSFSSCGNVNRAREWFGFRPFRANSIPLICRVEKYDNFFINAGHGSLGWTLSAGSGRIVADLVVGKEHQQLSFLKEEACSIY